MSDDDESDILVAPEAVKQKPRPKVSIKVPEKADDDEVDSPVQKIKPPRSAAQVAAFKKVQAKRDENRVQRLVEKKLKEKADQEELEAKLVKKAVSIKKKQIKKQAILDEISDDDTPIETIRAVQKPVKRIEPVHKKYLYAWM